MSFEMSIDELKEELNLYTVDSHGKKEYKYTEYPAFKRDVLNKSVKEIIKHTEIKELSFEVSGKIGRKVNTLKFTYSLESTELPNEDSEFLDMFDKKFPSVD